MITDISSLISYAATGNNDTGIVEVDRHDQVKHKILISDQLTADAGSDQLVKGGDEVTLDAGKYFENDKTDKLTFLWTQIEPKRPELKIYDPDTPKAKFTAPDVDHTRVFKFKLFVDDGKEEKTDTVRVKVVNDVENANHDSHSKGRNEKTLGVNSAENSKNSSASKHENNNSTNDNNTKFVSSDENTQNKKDNNAILNESGLSLNCDPVRIKITEENESSILCVVKNNTQKFLTISLRCSGLEDTGIECFVNGEHTRTSKVAVKEMSSERFAVIMNIKPSGTPPMGSFQYTITAECRDKEC